MMSLIDLDDDQRWVPTHVNVTVLRARGLRTKGKHGSRYLYTVMQVGKEKYTTGLVEKAEVPEWNEECCFELLPGILEDGGRGAFPPGSGDLVLTVMHRVLIGLDVFLGQTVIPLDRMFREGTCPRDEYVALFGFFMADRCSFRRSGEKWCCRGFGWKLCRRMTCNFSYSPARRRCN